MPKFTLICEHEKPEFQTSRESRLTFEAEFLDDVLSHFTEFLRGASYYFDGDVVIVDRANNES